MNFNSISLGFSNPWAGKKAAAENSPMAFSLNAQPRLQDASLQAEGDTTKSKGKNDSPDFNAIG